MFLASLHSVIPWYRSQGKLESTWNSSKVHEPYSRFVHQTGLQSCNFKSYHQAIMTAKPILDRDYNLRHQVQWRIAQLARAHLRAPTASGSVDRPLSVALQWQNGCETTPAIAAAACRSEGGRAAAVRKASNVGTERRGQGAPKIWFIHYWIRRSTKLCSKAIRMKQSIKQHRLTH